MSAPLNTTVMWLTGRQLFAKKRLPISLLLVVAPALIALLYRFNGADPDGVGFLSTVFRDVIISVLLPIAALIFGTSAFGGEVDDGTLVYLMVKPIQRWTITLSKYVVAVLATLGVIIPSILLTWVATPGDIDFHVPLAYATGGAFGAAVYCAVFVTLGVTSRRALAIGLIYIIAFENILARAIPGMKFGSIREFALGMSKSVLGTAAEFSGITLSMPAVWIMGSIFLVGALGWGVLKVRSYEVAEQL